MADADDRDLVLDVRAYRLLRRGRRVPLQRTPMELLTLLVERRGALVTREEIVARIWGGDVHVDADAGINTAIRKIRVALGDDPASPTYLETEVGKGYRFVGTIAVSGSARPADEAPADRAQPVRTSNPWRRLVPAAALAVVAAVGLALLWTESFDRAIEPSSSRSEDRAVIDAYLHGRFEMGQYPLPDLAKAYFKRAVALDRTYAPALAGLADFFRSRAIADDADAEVGWRSAEQFAEQAVALAPNLSEPHVALAQIRLMHDWDWPAAREHALRAVELNPSSPEAHAVLARYLRVAGDVAGAVAERKSAVALDPLRADLVVHFALEQWFARAYDDSAASARRALTIDPGNSTAHGLLCDSLARLGRSRESLTECREALVAEGHRDWVAPYEVAYQRRGYDAATMLIADRDLAEMRRQPHPDLWNYANACVLAGRRDETFALLFQAVRTHEPGLLQIRVDPDFDSIRSDPRYAELVREIQFPRS